MLEISRSKYEVTRQAFQRSMALIYLLAFLGTAFQFKALCGERGLTPLPLYLDRVRFLDTPGLFWLNSSDLFTGFIAWAGVALSLLALSGFSERFGIYISTAVWGTLWLFYLSFVNAGQTFYSFGWETMTLEVGFLAIFLGSRDSKTPAAVIWFLRWVLFRLMLGAGLIKLRGDNCWRDFTAMFYHYETQPIPNPLSWYFHHFSPALHKFEVWFMYFVELVVPFAYFGPRRARYLAGIATILFQATLILSGNLSWLNYLTIVIAIACFDDHFFEKYLRFPALQPQTAVAGARKVILWILSGTILLLSFQPAFNLFSPHQRMNTSFDSLHLVNAYGAFGSITQKRREIIFEGTSDTELTERTVWKEYGFKAKPGDIHKTSPIISPYHLRLDWLLWFAAMVPWRYHPWILPLTGRLLQNDPEILKQIRSNPFPDSPPYYIRATLYDYRFTTPEEKKATGNWWVREPVSEYLPPLSLQSKNFRFILKRLGWEE